MNDDLQLDKRSHNETSQSSQAVVLLGASNLSRAFPIAVTMLQQTLRAPLTIYAAKGHGRSYGQESSCFGKKNSGIFSCGIWRAIEQQKSLPITAFLTDVGNDLAYEVPVETVVDWVEACLDRLLAKQSHAVLSDLPIDVLRHVSDARYRLFRRILFPHCGLDWAEMLTRAEQLSERLQQLAESREVPFFKVRSPWYGLDPIHPRRRFYPALWAELLSIATARQAEVSDRGCSLATAWYLRSLRCERDAVFSFSRHAAQPSGRLRDGSTIALY